MFRIGALVSGLCIASCAVIAEPEVSGPTLVRSEPADGDEDVSRLGPFRLLFDQHLDPRSVARASLAIESGTSRSFLSVTYDPVEQAVVSEPFFGAPLLPDVRYRMELDTVIGLDGRAATEPVTVTFRTGDDASRPELPQVDSEEALRLLLTTCGSTDCHGGPSPALGLDLSSFEGIERTAIGVPARQVLAWGGAERFGPGLLGAKRIDVLGGQGRPQRSYLLYKVLPSSPTSGLPMPPGGPSLSPTQIRLLSDWIRAGAPPP